MRSRYAPDLSNFEVKRRQLGKSSVRWALHLLNSSPRPLVPLPLPLTNKTIFMSR